VPDEERAGCLGLPRADPDVAVGGAGCDRGPGDGDGAGAERYGAGVAESDGGSVSVRDDPDGCQDSHGSNEQAAPQLREIPLVDEVAALFGDVKVISGCRVHPAPAVEGLVDWTATLLLRDRNLEAV
jgi:hypothetical protein